MEISKETYQNLLQQNKELKNELSKCSNAENKYQTEILDTISEPTSFVDVNYKYVYVNKAYSKYFNKSPSEIIGHFVIEFAGKENFNSQIKPHFDTCLKGELVEYENLVNFNDNNGIRNLLMNYYPHYDENNKINGVISTAKDITDVSKLKKEWIDTVNSLDDILIVINKDLEIEQINNKGLELIGKNKTEIIGKKCFNIIHNKDKSENFCPVLKSLKSKKTETTEHYEKMFNRWFSLKSSPVFNATGEIVKYVDLMRDITDLKTKENQLITAINRIEEKELKLKKQNNFTQTLFKYFAY